MSDWQAAQHQDELVRQEEIRRILLASTQRPLTQDEQQTIALEAGLGDVFRSKSSTSPTT